MMMKRLVICRTKSTNMTELEILKEVKSMNRKRGNLKKKTVKDLKKDTELLKQQNGGLSNQVSELSKSQLRYRALGEYD